MFGALIGPVCPLDRRQAFGAGAAHGSIGRHRLPPATSYLNARMPMVTGTTGTAIPTPYRCDRDFLSDPVGRLPVAERAGQFLELGAVLHHVVDAAPQVVPQRCESGQGAGIALPP